MRYFASALLFLAACGTPVSTPVSPDTGTHDAGSAPDARADAGDASSSWSVEDYVQASEVGAVPAYEQREGNPERGYDILVNRGYVSCGIPARIYDEFFGSGETPDWAKLPGRSPENAELPFNQTRFERDGIELVSTNCLACHANTLPTGELMVGLGYEGDYTGNTARLIELGRGLVDEENEREVFEYDRFLERTSAVQPYIRTSTIGVNPADNIANILTAHRDPDTWEWLPEPWFELPEVEPIPLSVPPWWHVKKKNALYYTTIGRGDHARFMMAAALLCTDSVEEARKIDEWFVDVRAFIETVEPPRYPYAIDDAQLARGEEVFDATCSRCHGTYGAAPTYPNLVVSVDEVGTDSMLADQGGFAEEAVAWMNRAFFGEVSIVAPAPGYMAPPLDGIWATAPYLHNASVPTLDAVINPALRPTYWQRNGTYDIERVGIGFDELAAGKDSAETEDERRAIYETTLPGYSNAGHTFGADLSGADQAALLEYLKTL